MVNNSIYSLLSKEELFAELKLQLSAPSNQFKTFVIFEGINDITFFKPLLSNECFLFESYGGKQAIEEIISKVFKDKRVISIRDKDYLLQPSDERIFFCDNCNVEMMVIGNDIAFSNIMFKILRINDNYISVRDKILKGLLVLSATRKANEDNIWGINFKDISVGYLLSQNDPINIDDLFEHINRKSNNLLTQDKKTIIFKQKQIIEHDLLQYTNGHDFCAALVCFLKKQNSCSTNVKSLGSDAIHLMLSLGYNVYFFSQTNLYFNLLKYQQQHDLKIVIKD